jgi:hypothetical protein
MMAQVKVIIDYAESRKKPRTVSVVHHSPDVAKSRAGVSASELPGPEQSHEKLPDRHDVNKPSAIDQDFSHLSISPAQNKQERRATTQPKTKTIRTLPEPIPTRNLTTKEKILVLKSSKFNGFKFPLWTPPTDAEFELDDTGVPFTDSHELILSEHQLQFFLSMDEGTARSSTSRNVSN